MGLSQFESVLTRTQGAAAGRALAHAGQTIAFDNGEDAHSRRALYLSADDYLDFGEPGELTILVRPGDRMNDDDNS